VSVRVHHCVKTTRSVECLLRASEIWGVTCMTECGSFLTSVDQLKSEPSFSKDAVCSTFCVADFEFCQRVIKLILLEEYA